jgi:HemY protein
MRRTIWLFVKIAIVVAVAVWVARHPGTVGIDWLGWRVEMSVGVALLTGLVIVAVVALGYASWRALRRSPRSFLHARQDRRRAAGYRALTEGLVAVAAGNPDEARRHARKADKLLDEPPLTLLLSAQAAQLSGDTAAAKRDFEAMLKRPETEFLGLRGLIVQALKEDDQAGALALTRRAYALRPATPWVLETLIDLHSKAGDWRETQKFLIEARHGNIVTSTEAAVQEAALLAERARTSAAAGREEEAYEQARRAHDLDPALAPATLLLARGVAAAGRVRRARKLVEAGWRAGPHPALAPLYLEIVGAASALDRYTAIKNLVEEIPAHVESRVALAEAAAAAGLWGEARHQLDALAEADRTARVWRLQADIAEADPADARDAPALRDTAAAAPPDPAWVCGECGTISDEWMGVCGNCGALAGLAWTSPRRMHRLVLGGATGGTAAAGVDAVPAAATPALATAAAPPANART